jgi:hypothetical protein
MGKPGRKAKCTEDVRDFLEVRTIQEAQLGNAALAREISERFHKNLSPRTVDRVRKDLKFNFQRARHVQSLTEVHIQKRKEFCDLMLQWTDDALQTICFSDESRVVLGHDNMWVWYRRGEDNPSANFETLKFAPSLMVFGVIGVGYKSRLLFIEGSINTDKYIENCEQLGFIQQLDNIPRSVPNRNLLGIAEENGELAEAENTGGTEDCFGKCLVRDSPIKHRQSL